MIERLPPLLDELEPTADRLAALASDATPTLRDLRRAAPGAEALLEDFDPVADAARPALKRLAETSEVGRRAVRAARPVAARLKPVAAILPPIAELAADLQESVRDSGAVEGLQLYTFYGAGAQARFDQFSHILPSYQLAGPCQQYAREPAPGAVRTSRRLPRNGNPRLPPRQVSSRGQNSNSLAGSPVLVGAATVLCAVVAVFLSYNANNGLPFVPTYDVTVQVPDAAGLVRGNEVRIGGKRVGVIEEIRAVDGRGRRPGVGARRLADHEARAAARGLGRDGPAAIAARPQVPGAEAGRLRRGHRGGIEDAARGRAADRRARRGHQRVRLEQPAQRCAQVLDGVAPGFAGPRRRRERAAGRRAGALCAAPGAWPPT